MHNHTDVPALLAALLQKREAEDLEFKLTVSSSFKLAKEIAAMANTLGGNIIIGVDDSGSIAGLDNPEQEQHLILKAVRDHCDPPLAPQVRTVSVKGKFLLWLIIGRSSLKHSVVDPQGNALFYVRVKDKNLLASKKTARQLRDGPRLKLSLTHLDRHEKLLVDYLRKQEQVTLREFSHLANLSKRRATRILTRLEQAGLIRSHDFEKRVFYTLNPQGVKE